MWGEEKRKPYEVSRKDGGTLDKDATSDSNNYVWCCEH